jgi:hypothetical protein
MRATLRPRRLQSIRVARSAQWGATQPSKGRPNTARSANATLLSPFELGALYLSLSGRPTRELSRRNYPYRSETMALLHCHMQWTTITAKSPCITRWPANPSKRNKGYQLTRIPSDDLCSQGSQHESASGLLLSAFPVDHFPSDSRRFLVHLS